MNRAVLFDFDFTLADSSAGIVECVQFAMHRLALDGVGTEAVRRTVGLSLADSFIALTGRDDPALLDAFSRLFIERADKVMVSSTSLYPESAHVLRQLREHGISTAIVSAKLRCRIEAILAAANLSDAVDVIVGGEDVAEHKPHPAGLRQALSRLAVDPATTLYVGDHPVDGMAARNAGIRFVRVLTGEDHGAAAWTVEPYATLENVGGLLNVLDMLG